MSQCEYLRRPGLGIAALLSNTSISAVVTCPGSGGAAGGGRGGHWALARHRHRATVTQNQ